MSQLQLFNKPQTEKPAWSVFGIKQVILRDKIWTIDVTNWRPSTGDIVEYYDGYALVNENQMFVGWCAMAYVLEVFKDDVALLYSPGKVFYDHNSEWIGLGSIQNCYPVSMENGSLPKFLKANLSENVLDIYPYIEINREEILSQLIPVNATLFGNERFNNTTEANLGLRPTVSRKKKHFGTYRRTR